VAAVVVAALACATGAVQADEPAPRWEVGVVAFGVSQQAWPGASAQVRRAYPLPYAFYRGPVLRVDQDTVGLRAMKTPGFELDVGFAGAFGSRAQDIPARRGMPDLGTLVEFGPRGTWQLGRSGSGTRWQFELPLRGVFDVDARGASRGFTLEPRLEAQNLDVAGWKMTTSASVLLGDQRINDTVFGVDPRYATAARPAWEGRPGLVAWRLSFSASRALSPSWHLFTFARADNVSGAANFGSPLVERRIGVTAGAGLRWTMLQSRRAENP
jgi:outer membrane scaffolding protein for murein synthesis (MipA/OmpV family)